MAYGENVLLESNPSLHVAAHEAAHVVQQRGRARFLGLGRAGDAHEQHADRVAQRVERGESAEHLLDSYAPRGATETPNTFQMYGNITMSPEWLKVAGDYEERLGQYAYRHPTSQEAISRALGRMREVIDQRYPTDDDGARTALYQKVFAGDDPTSAGQIGGRASFETIDRLLTHGNLRERMTAFYNAAYFNTAGGQGAPGLKDTISWVIEDPQHATARALGLGLDEPALASYSQMMAQGRRRQAAQFAAAALRRAGLGDHEYHFGSDPFALGNLLIQDGQGLVEIIRSQRGRHERPQADRQDSGKTARQYRKRGMPLSKRELSHVMALDPNFRRSFRKSAKKAKLPWVAGESRWALPAPYGPEPTWLWQNWVHEVQSMRHTPVATGVSGTTTRMLNAFRWLGTGAPALNFRLALIGWMVPQDHTLYEVLRGGQLAGVGRDLDLSDVTRMYANIAPLGEIELRKHVGKDNMFPHEQLYLRMLTKKKKLTDPAEDFSGIRRTKKQLDAIREKVGAQDNPRFTRSHAGAVYLYTTGLHKLINNRGRFFLNIPNHIEGTTRRYVRTMLLDLKRQGIMGSTASDAEQRELEEYEREDDLIAWQPLPSIRQVSQKWVGKMFERSNDPTQADFDAVFEVYAKPYLERFNRKIMLEVEAHRRMAVDGIRALPPVEPMRIWRGDWAARARDWWEHGRAQLGRYGYIHDGAELTLQTLTSFSMEEQEARRFMGPGSRLKARRLYVVQTRQGGLARNIAGASHNPDEEEIVMLPGARLRVERVEYDDSESPGYQVVRCREL